MDPSTQSALTPTPTSPVATPPRRVLPEVPSAHLTADQQTAIRRLLHESGKALAVEKAGIVGAQSVDEARLIDVEQRIAVVEKRLTSEFGKRPELAVHFQQIFNQYLDKALLQVATGEMRVLGRDRREASGLQGNGNELGVVTARDRYLDREPIREMLARHSRAAEYLRRIETSSFEYTDEQYKRAAWVAGECWEAIRGIGFSNSRFRAATSELTRYQLDLVYRYYARLSDGSNLRQDLKSQWSSDETEYRLISFSNPKFNGSDPTYNRDPRLYGRCGDHEAVVEAHITTQDLGRATEALLSQEPADVVASRLYMSLHGGDSLAIAIDCFMNVREEDRHVVLRTFYRRFEQTYSELASRRCELEEGIAARHLADDGQVNEWEVTRIVNDRAKRLGTEIGTIRARESGETTSVRNLERRFEREVLDIYRNNPSLVVRDEALRARILGMTLEQLELLQNRKEGNPDAQIAQVVAQTRRRMELLTLIKDGQVKVTQQQCSLDVITKLQARLSWVVRSPEEAGNLQHLEKMLRERIEEYYRKQKRFHDENPEFEDALRRAQKRVDTETIQAADRVIRAIGDIESGSEKWYALGTGLFTDDDKIYAALKTLRTKEERETFSAWYQHKHGTSVRSLFRNEFSGIELDKANALLEGSLAKAAAADIALCMTNTWDSIFGRDTKKLEQSIREVSPEDRAKIEEHFNTHYARDVTYTTTDYSSNSASTSRAGGSVAKSTTHHCTSLRDALGNLYTRDELIGCVALLENNNSEHRIAAVHALLSKTYVTTSPEKQIGKILEQFYEDSPFELDRASGEWKLTDSRKKEIEAFVTEYNRRFNTDIRADLDRKCSAILDPGSPSDGARWCRALLDGKMPEANAYKFRAATGFWSNDRRMIMEILDVPANIQGLPDRTAQELTAAGKGSDILDAKHHDALVEQKRNAVACQKALNAQMEAVYAELRPGFTFRDDLKEKLEFVIQSDGELLYTVAVRRLERGTATDTERLLEETQYSSMMSEVDGSRINALTKGKTKAELAEMRKEAEVLIEAAQGIHKTLDAVLLSKLSGDKEFDVRDNLKGEAETVGEMEDRAAARLRYERSGLLVAISGLIASNVTGESPVDRHYDALKRFAQTHGRDTKIADLSSRDRSRLNALNAKFLAESENIRTFKNSFAEIATTIAVIAVSVTISVVSMGSATPWLVMLYVAGASLGTTFLAKHLIRGDGFSLWTREAVTDAAFSLVDGALSAAGGWLLTKHVDKAAKAFAKRFANTWLNRQCQRVWLLRGLRSNTIERALAAEDVIGQLGKALKNGTITKAAYREQVMALKIQARSMLLEHARAMTTDIFTSWASSGIQTAAHGNFEGVGGFFTEWGSSTFERLKVGLPANFISTRLVAAGERARFSRNPNHAMLTRNARREINAQVKVRATPHTSTPIPAEDPILRRPSDHTDPLTVTRGLADGSGTRPTGRRSAQAIIDEGHQSVAHHEHQLLLLSKATTDPVGDALAVLRGGSKRGGSRLPRSEAELVRMGNKALARAGTDPDAIFAVTVAIQRLNMMIPPTDVAGTCRLIGGINWQKNAGFQPLLESRSALRVWFDTLTQGAPKAYRDAAKKHFDVLSKVVPPGTLADACADLGYAGIKRIPKTRAEVATDAQARLAGSPRMDPARLHAFSRAVELVLESIRPKTLADHAYTLYLGKDIVAARRPVTGTAFEPGASANAGAKLKRLFDVARMNDTKARALLTDQRAAGALRDGRVFDRHLDLIRTGATAKETALINRSAKAVKDHVGKSRYHEALDEFGLGAGSKELTSRRDLRDVCRKRLETAPKDEHLRIKQLREVLELHIPASRGWKAMSWCLRQVGIVTVHEALTRLNLVSRTGLSPDALTPDGVRTAYRTQRAVYERNLAEAPTSRSQKYWKRAIAQLDDGLTIAQRKLPFGTTNPEIVNSLATLKLPQSEKYSAVAIDRAANRALGKVGGHPDLIAEINGARATLKASLPEFPARSWYNLRRYTTDRLFGRTVRGFQHADLGTLKNNVAIARQRFLDYQETLAAFKVGSDRKLPPSRKQVQDRMNDLLRNDPLRTPQSQAKIRAMADLMNEIVSRRSIPDRLVARHVNAADLMVFANEGTQTARTTRSMRGVDTRTERIVLERTLAARAKIYEDLHTAAAECANRLGLSSKRVHTPAEIEGARTKALNAAGTDKAKCIQIQVDADLLLCIAGKRPWSIAHGTPIGDAAHTLTLRKTLAELYTSVYDARVALGLSIKGNPFATTFAKAGLDGVDIVAACRSKLAERGANVPKLLAARDFLLAINDAHRAPIWSFGLRTSTRGGAQGVPSLETFEAYHVSRVDAMKALKIHGSPRDGQPLYTERDLVTLRQRRLTGVSDIREIARVEAAHDFLVADLKSGKAQNRYTARWRVYADTAGAPLTIPAKVTVAALQWGVTKTLNVAWGLATFVLPGKATAIAATYVKRFVVHGAEALYGVFPKWAQRVCDVTIGNLRRAVWVVDEGVSTGYRRSKALVTDGVETVLGRRSIWGCDPTVETFHSRVEGHTRRLVGVSQAEAFIGTLLGDPGAVKGLKSLATLDEKVQGLLQKVKSDADRLRVIAARDQVAQDIVHRQSGVMLHRDAAGALFHSGRAYLFDYVIKIGIIRGALEVLDKLRKLNIKQKLSLVTDGSENCESDNDVFGITKEDVERNPVLAPLLLADQDAHRAQFSESMIEAFGGAQLSAKDRELYERAQNARQVRDALARYGRGSPHQLEPTLWNDATRTTLGKSSLPVDMQRWHTGASLRADVTSYGFDPDPMGARASVRLLNDDELATAILPPRNSTTTRLDTSFTPSIGVFRAAGPNAPLPLNAVDRAYRFMTLDLPKVLSPVTSVANSAVSSLVVRPFSPTRLDENDAIRFGPLTLR